MSQDSENYAAPFGRHPKLDAPRFFRRYRDRKGRDCRRVATSQLQGIQRHCHADINTAVIRLSSQEDSQARCDGRAGHVIPDIKLAEDNDMRWSVRVPVAGGPALGSR